MVPLAAFMTSFTSDGFFGTFGLRQNFASLVRLAKCARVRSVTVVPRVPFKTPKKRLAFLPDTHHFPRMYVPPLYGAALRVSPNMITVNKKPAEAGVRIFADYSLVNFNDRYVDLFGLSRVTLFTVADFEVVSSRDFSVSVTFNMGVGVDIAERDGARERKD